MTKIERQGPIAILKIDKGDKNPMDGELLERLGKALGELRDDPEVRGLVLGSTSERFFSIGFDIPNLFGLDRDEFGLFFKAFNELCLDLYSFPKPTAAAVTGHATAGGFILTLACDHRIVADGRHFMGLNEAKLGVPVPYFAELVLEQIAGKANAKEHIEEGEFFLPEEALEMGVADYVLPAEQVMPRAVETVSGVDAGILATFGAIKKARVSRIKKAVRKTMDEKTGEFLDHWYSPAAREKLREAMKKY